MLQQEGCCQAVFFWPDQFVFLLAGAEGMLLTMADTSCGGLLAGHTGMSLYGPPGLNTLVNAFRTFVNVRDIGLKVNEFSDNGTTQPVVKTELVTITPVTLTAATPGQASAHAQEERACAAEPEAKRQRMEATNGDTQQGGGSVGMEIASVVVESPAACYICELSDVPGKFLPQKVCCMGCGYPHSLLALPN